MGYCSGYNLAWLRKSKPLEFDAVLALDKEVQVAAGGIAFFLRKMPGWATLIPEQETANLKAQTDLLQVQLDAIQKRIEEVT